MNHIVLLGDSIFDNGVYVPGELASFTRVPQMWLVPLSHTVSRSCKVVLPNFAIGGVKVDDSNWTG
jgi:hypothetical protein